MRVLVNYDPKEKQYLPLLAHALRAHGISAASTAATHTISELTDKALGAGCTGILLCNTDTLRNLVMGKDPTLDKWRGSRLNLKPPVIITNSLAHLATVSHGPWLLDQDLKKFASIHIPPQVFTFHVLKDTCEFEAAYAALAQSPILSYDVETDVLNAPKKKDPSVIAGTSVITSASWTGINPEGKLFTYVLPMLDFGQEHWQTVEEHCAAIAFLRKVNALPSIKVMQNGMYDATQSICYHAEPVNWQYDTLGMAHSEYSELPKDLGFIASYQLYDYVYWKDDADEAKKVKDLYKFWAYNAKDTWNTLRIMFEQLRTAPAYAYRNYAEQFPLVFPSLYCSFEGLLIDNEVREKARAKSVKQLEAALATLRIMFDDPNFNPGSWQQVEKYVYQVFGAKKPGVGKSNSGTDEKNLVVVAQQHPLLAKLVTEILSYREAQKAIGTYYDFLQKESRLLYALDPFGTESGRMACRASSLWCGTQVQNIPGYAKEMLVADDGYELIEVDNSQSEARCTAYCSQEEALIAALESATHDFYKTLGTLFFNIPYEEVTDFFRNKVLKKIVHGTNYMMGAKTFIENIGIQILHEAATKLGLKLVAVPRKNSTAEITIQAFAKQLLDAYHKPFPRVREWYKEIALEIQVTGCLTSPLGHVRKFFGNISRDHAMLRGAVAHQPQHLSVSILNKGFRRVYKELVIPSKGAYRLKAQIHDSILAQYKKTEREYWATRQMECMRNPVTVHGRVLAIPIDAKVGSDWSKSMQKFHPA